MKIEVGMKMDLHNQPPECVHKFFFKKFVCTDEDDEPRRCVQLTNQHKGAIRAIRKVSFE